MKPFLCKCGSKNFIEITDGLWQKTLWEYNEKKKCYVEAYTKHDGCGDHTIECAECGETIKTTNKQMQEFVQSAVCL